MTLADQISVLKKPNRWLFIGKDRTQEKLEALEKIARGEGPSAIAHLFDFLKDEEINLAVCKAISHLFRKLDENDNPYEILKWCAISESDLDYFRSTFGHHELVDLLLISSVNKNGRVREKSLLLLGEIGDPRAIPFLLTRLGDWVEQVRRAATDTIRRFLTDEYLENLIEVLPKLERLQDVKRTDLSGIYNEIVGFLVTANHNFVVNNFSSFAEKQRFTLARHISKALIDREKDLDLLLSDKNYLIRNLAIDHLPELNQIQIDSLLIDKAALVRLNTLYALNDKGNFNDIVKPFLADSSGSVRQLARFTLRKSGLNFAELYAMNLLERRNILGSIQGLAEINAKDHAGVVIDFLKDENAKIRRTAFFALVKLSQPDAYMFALENIDRESGRLASAIIDFLATYPTVEVMEKARTIFRQGDSSKRISILKLFSNVGGWTAIPDLMSATVDDDRAVRELSIDYLDRWKTKAARMFVPPKPGEKEIAQQVFDIILGRHQKENFFESNPLYGLEFYLK